MSELALCSAGSLLGIFFTDVSFPVGKVDFLNMHPLSFEEFLRGVDEEEAASYISDKDKQKDIPSIVHDRLWQLLKHFFVTGGLPEVVNTYRDNKNDLYAAMTQVREKQNTLISAYHADIAKHSGKENAMHISAVLKNIPNQLAREQDGSVTRFRFTQVIPGASKYSRLIGKIHWLETAGLILRVPIVNRAQFPLAAYTKDNFFKLYLFDVGILGALSNLSPKTILDYDYGSYKGYFAENFFVQEEQSIFNNSLHGWKEGGAEVEFLKEMEGDIYPIEVKLGFVTQAKSLKVYAKKYNPKYRVIVSANPLVINPTNKILKCPLYLTAHLESFLQPPPCASAK
jgi:predicted AAA+ superfamily ATPase